MVGAGTLLDGNPLNNFLKRELTFNPDGLLCGANAITIVGTYAYICCDAGLVVVDLDDPKKPKVTAVLGKRPVEASARRGGAVPLRLRLRRRGHQGAGHDRPGPSARREPR